jgi:DNA-binding transcriptional regulator YdaS (Cro superfamily)
MRTGASATADCPLAPPALETTYVRALHHACLVVGGVAQLASHLKVSEYAVNTWLEGREELPETIFLAAVEVILLAAERTPGSAS